MPGGPMADQGCHGKLTCNRTVTGCHRLSQAVTAVTAVTRCHMLSHAVTGLRMLPLQGRGTAGLLARGNPVSPVSPVCSVYPVRSVF